MPDASEVAELLDQLRQHQEVVCAAGEAGLGRFLVRHFLTLVRLADQHQAARRLLPSSLG